ncbi:hypothetical protein NBRC116597_29200 [Phaeobacter sp. NW0010-22]
MQDPGARARAGGLNDHVAWLRDWVQKARKSSVKSVITPINDFDANSSLAPAPKLA